MGRRCFPVGWIRLRVSGDEQEDDLAEVGAYRAQLGALVAVVQVAGLPVLRQLRHEVVRLIGELVRARAGDVRRVATTSSKQLL